MRELIRYALTLMLVTSLAAGLLAGVYIYTEPKRVAAEKAEERAALKEVLPQADEGSFKPFREGEEVTYYRAYNSPEKQEIVGYAFLAAGRGYSSVIKTMVGIDTEGRITGIKILSQQETPGLGARVEEVATSKTLWSALAVMLRGGGELASDDQTPWFQEQFKEKTTVDLEVVRGKTTDKIEAITGATISSRAVTDSVRERLNEVWSKIVEEEKGRK